MPVRIAAFVSHACGLAVLDSLLSMPDLMRVVLIASDDPWNEVCNPPGRIWRYGRSTELCELVSRRAAEVGVEAYTGSVKTDEFYRAFAAARPAALVTAVFGQKLPRRLLEFVGGQAWNTHPVLPGRPLEVTKGPAPFETALQHRAGAIQVCLHRMTEEMDAGEELARSDAVPFPRTDAEVGGQVLEVQYRFGRQAAELVRQTLPTLLSAAPRVAAPPA